MLELGLLDSVQPVYNKIKKLFDLERLVELRRRFSKIYANLPALPGLLARMLEPKEPLRPDFLQLQASLPDWEDILAQVRQNPSILRPEGELSRISRTLEDFEDTRNAGRLSVSARGSLGSKPLQQKTDLAAQNFLLQPPQPINFPLPSFKSPEKGFSDMARTNFYETSFDKSPAKPPQQSWAQAYAEAEKVLLPQYTPQLNPQFNPNPPINPAPPVQNKVAQKLDMKEIPLLEFQNNESLLARDPYSNHPQQNYHPQPQFESLREHPQTNFQPQRDYPQQNYNSQNDYPPQSFQPPTQSEPQRNYPQQNFQPPTQSEPQRNYPQQNFQPPTQSEPQKNYPQQSFQPPTQSEPQRDHPQQAYDLQRAQRTPYVPPANNLPQEFTESTPQFEHFAPAATSSQVESPSAENPFFQSTDGLFLQQSDPYSSTEILPFPGAQAPNPSPDIGSIPLSASLPPAKVLLSDPSPAIAQTPVQNQKIAAQNSEPASQPNQTVLRDARSNDAEDLYEKNGIPKAYRSEAGVLYHSVKKEVIEVNDQGEQVRRIYIRYEPVEEPEIPQQDLDSRPQRDLAPADAIPQQPASLQSKPQPESLILPQSFNQNQTSFAPNSSHPEPEASHPDSEDISGFKGKQTLSQFMSHFKDASKRKEIEESLAFLR